MIDAYPTHDLGDKLATFADLSVGSPQVQSLIESGADAFHLSPQRADLLRPVRHLLRHSVLELGAGCGPITRFLGEQAQRVVAVEPHTEWARINRLRCANLPHVSIRRDVPRTATGAPELFAAVVCVGPRGALPDAIAQARQHLAPGGTLILAVENQLGLKYLAGACDDRTALPYHGIHDSYAAAQAQPLGRQMLSQLLCAGGFACTTFMMPFPDWQQPVVVLTPAGARAPGPLMANLLRRAAPDRAGSSVRAFSEELAWPLVQRNGLTEDLANAFLLLARREPQAPQPLDADALAYCYSTTGRPRNFAKETVLRGPSGAARIERRRLYPELPPQVGNIVQVLVDEAAAPGDLYMGGLTEAVNRSQWSIASLASWVQPWAHYLRAQQLPGSPNAAAQIPGQLVDCVPFNLLVQPHGKLHAFDLEWQVEHPIPTLWVLMRGLLYSLARVHSAAPPRPGTPENLLELTCQVLLALGWEANEAAVDNLLARESSYFGFPAQTLRHWQLSLRCQPGVGVSLPAGYAAPAGGEEALRHEIASLKNRLARALAHGAAGQRPRLPITPRRLAAVAQRLLSGGNRRPAADWGWEWVRPFIDGAYYLAHNPDVSESGNDPVLHYLDRGAHEGRNPNDWFNTRFYVRTNPDVAHSGINPLVHYVLFGWREGRPTQTLQSHPEERV